MKKEIISIIKKGGIGVMPTDTIFGLVGKAENKKTVEKIYKVRKRNPLKPFIILISKIDDIKKFGVKNVPKELSKLWPGPVSIIFPVQSKKFEYLHRGTKTLCFRLPKNKKLKSLIAKTGPLVAPSANIEGMPPARGVLAAKAYFGSQVDFYTSGRTKTTPSTILSHNPKIGFRVEREGTINISRLRRLKLIK